MRNPLICQLFSRLPLLGYTRWATAAQVYNSSQMLTDASSLACDHVSNAGSPTGSYAVLSDIMGTEDALGDMDFKVAGDADTLTAFQMDTKAGPQAMAEPQSQHDVYDVLSISHALTHSQGLLWMCWVTLGLRPSQVEGVTIDIMRRTLAQARDGRRHILGEMAKCSPAPRMKLSPYAPRMHHKLVSTSCLIFQ